ncbi:MAG TPA: precorrin-6y C5,15-methyltransferase (decarboxylating) subunit CbiE [Planctomycetota bacterium]|jgi:precorrin-6y C5,15-methyltransferase (decarboxylating) CbiE subunit
MAQEVMITICGCGPGAPEYITPAVRQAVSRAEVLAGAQRLLNVFRESAAERIVVGADTNRALDEIAAHVERHVVVLVTGDAGLYSFSQAVVKRFGRAACRIVPGISSVQVAFARLGLDWHDARILSAHHLTPDADLRDLTRGGKIAVLLGRKDSLTWVEELARTLGDTYRIFIFENLTLKDERVREVVRADLSGLNVSSLSIALLIEKGLLV